MALETLLLLCALLLGGCASGRHSGSGGADTPYPYGWKEERNGTVTVTLADAPEGFAWTAESVDESVVTVEQKKNGSYSAVPVGENAATLHFTLENSLDADDCLVRLSLGVDVTRSKKTLDARILSDVLELLPGMVRGGEEFGCPYKLWTDDDGLLNLFLSDDAGDWQLLSPTASGAETVVFDPSGVTGRFSASEDDGAAPLKLISASKQLTLTLWLSSEKGTLAVLDHRMEKQEDWTDRPEGYAAAAALAGYFEPPKDAENVSYATAPLGHGDGGEAALMRFDRGSVSWELYAATGFDLTALYRQDAASVDQTLLSGIEVSFLSGEDQAAAFWREPSGRSCLLLGQGGGAEAAVLQTAAALFPSNEGHL